MVSSPLVPSQQHYYLHLKSISVNDKTLSIDPSVFESSNGQKGTVIDSGTTLGYLAEEAYDPFIRKSVPQSVEPFDGKGYQCYVTKKSVSEVFPNVSLNFVGDASMVSKPENYLLKQTGIVVIMYTRGRKKAEAAPAPPARYPRDVKKTERLQQRIRELEFQQDSPTEEAESEFNVWDDGPKDVNPFGGRKLRYRDRRYHPRRNDRAVDRDDRYHDDPIRSMGLKVKIPEFTGKVHPDDFIDWLSTVGRVFDVRGIPDKLKVKLVAIKLRQHASL
ncbi:reverse transcriptase domain-containing protein [Tanacetum coccineum]